MSLTSYRAAPPRAKAGCLCVEAERGTCEWVFGFRAFADTGFNAWRRPTLPLLEQ